MAMFGGKMKEAIAAAMAKQKRPMDPYQAGQGQQKFMDRMNQTRMGGRYQPGGDPRQQQGQTSGKANRQTVGGDAGGMVGRALGGRAAMAGQGQGGGQQTSGKPNRRTEAPPGTAIGQPGQGGRMWAGGSPGWAGGQGMAAPWQGSPETNPMTRGGGRSGKPNRRTVPGNAGGGMIGRGSMRGRGPRERLQRPPVNPRAKRQQANRALVRGGRAGGTTASRQKRNQPTKGGLLQKGAFG